MVSWVYRVPHRGRRGALVVGFLKGNPSPERVRWIRRSAGEPRFLVLGKPVAHPQGNDPTVTWFYSRALGMDWYDATLSAPNSRFRSRHLVIPYRLPFLLLAVLPGVRLYRL